MPRITIINQFYVPDISPTAHLTASLAAHLAGEGHGVTVVASRGGYTREADSSVASAESDQEQDRHAGSLRVHRIWTPRLGKARMIYRCIDYAAFYLLATWRVLTIRKQDVVLAMTTPPYVVWAAIFHKWLHRGTKIVMWNMDSFPEGAEYTGVIKAGSLPSRIMAAMNRFIFRRIEHMVCLDPAMVDLNRKYETEDHPLSVSVIPNWEPAAMFPPGAAAEPWAKAEALGLPGRFVVLYLGNAGYGHSFDAVLDAADELRNEPLAFLFVGGGQRWAWIGQQKQARNLDNVILHGYVPKDETPRVMAAADCALITLRDEALGINSPSKLHANLAMGLPILYVGPERSNVDEAIRRFGCGVSLRTGDAEGLASAIRRIASDESRRQTYRVRARRAFDEAYCDTRTLAQWDILLEEMFQERAGASERAGCDGRHEPPPRPRSAPSRTPQRDGGKEVLR